MSETKSVVVEREIPHPPEKIWRALTQAHLIEEWLMKNDFVLKLGHKFTLTGEWGGVLDCEVREIEDNRTLSYSWDFENEDPDYALKSVVTLTLTPSATGTLLRVEQAGFRPNQTQALGGAQGGWTAFLEKLEEVAGKAA